MHTHSKGVGTVVGKEGTKKLVGFKVRIDGAC